MKLAILGGSFNPPHIGHLALADAARIEFGYDKIAFIPAFISPFKTGAEFNSPQDRMEMVKLAIKGNPHFYCEDFEILQEGISFTASTIEYLYKKYSDGSLPQDERLEGKIGLILGGDAASDFPEWKNAKEIAEKTDLIAGKRFFSGAADFFENTGQQGCGGDFKKILKEKGFRFKELSNRILAVSSTQIRCAAASGKSWRYLVPAPVYRYICDNSLYGLPFYWLEKKITSVADYARNTLSEKRFAHSLRTAEYAQYLAELDEKTKPIARLAYFAGLAHDITKELPDCEQLKIIQREGGGIDEIEQSRLNLLHGRTAAFILKNKFGIKNREVLDAIRFHTFGHPSFGALGKILYLADKIEPGRKNAGHFRAEADKTPLSETVLNVLEWTAEFVEKKGGTIHHLSEKMLKNIKTELFK